MNETINNSTPDAQVAVNCITSLPASHPDADLLAACGEFAAANAELIAMSSRHAKGGDPLSDDEADRVTNRWDAAVDAVTDIPATTARGMVAKARVALIALPHYADPDVHESGVACAAAALDDLVALPGFDGLTAFSTQ